MATDREESIGSEKSEPDKRDVDNMRLDGLEGYGKSEDVWNQTHCSGRHNGFATKLFHPGSNKTQLT